MRPDEVRGKNTLVYTMGIEGQDLARWLLANGALVTMSDTRDAAGLAAASAAAPEGVERTVTGEPLLAPDGFDLVATSQSVLRSSEAVLRAAELGIPVISQMQLFLQLFPGRVIAITGSSGKTTTTSLVAAMARAAGIPTFLGGNIGGRGILSQLDGLDSKMTAVLEVSHTQLQYTERSPAVGAITNITPNHLDQFSWEEYIALKSHLLEYQRPGDVAVLNADDPVSRESVLPALAAEPVLATTTGAVIERGAALRDRDVFAVEAGSATPVVEAAEIPLRGEHNVANVVMACAVGVAAGFPVAAMREAILAFRPVPHRLEVVGRAGGVTYVNDSIATTPERTMAGLRAFEEPVVLLLGGREKNLPLAELAELVASRCRAIVCFGEAGPHMRDAIGPSARLVRTLDDAIAEAACLATPGDIVLMSPGGTSFDAYPNFESRGEAFRQAVRSLAGFEEVDR